MPNYAQAAIQIRQKKEREAKGKEIRNHQDSGSVQEYKVKDIQDKNVYTHTDNDKRGHTCLALIPYSKSVGSW